MSIALRFQPAFEYVKKLLSSRLVFPATISRLLHEFLSSSSISRTPHRKQSLPWRNCFIGQATYEVTAKPWRSEPVWQEAVQTRTELPDLLSPISTIANRQWIRRRRSLIDLIMKRTDPRSTTQPAVAAGTTFGMQPSAMPPNLRQQDGNAGPGGDRSPPHLPQEMLESIVRHTIAGETPRVSARQLALLQRVDQGFKAAAKSVLHSREQHEVGRETTRAQIEHLASRSTPDEFAAGMRSIVGNAPNVGISLRSLPEHLQATALQVLTEQTHLRSLELNAHEAPGIAQDAVRAMQVILPRNPQLHHADLRLGGCRLTMDDVNTIANSASLKSLTSLGLGNNAIDNEGAMALANSEHLKLRSLDLSGNRISDTGVTALANGGIARSLTSLSLRNNLRIGAQGVTALANSDKLAALTSLDLQGNLFIGDQGATALANSTHLRLRSLDLGEDRISDAGATALANSEMARSLTSLGLRDNYVGDRGVMAVAGSDKLRGLTSLDLQQCRVSAQGARALADSAHLRSLTSLNLENNAIGDGGVAALANGKGLHSLTFLGAGYNYIGDMGARALADSENASSLQILDLRGNSIGDEGMKAIADSGNLTSLKSLDLRHNNIGDEGARAVASSDKLGTETFIDFRNNRISDERAGELSARFKRVAV